MWLESIWGNEILTIFEILKQPNKSCDWNQHRGNEILTMLKILNASNRSLYWNQYEGQWNIDNIETVKQILWLESIWGAMKGVSNPGRGNRTSMLTIWHAGNCLLWPRMGHTPNHRIDPNMVQILCVQGDMTTLWVRVDVEFSAL